MKKIIACMLFSFIVVRCDDQSSHQTVSSQTVENLVKDNVQKSISGQKLLHTFSNISLPSSTNPCMQLDEPFVTTDLGAPMFDSEKLVQGAQLYANQVGVTIQSALLSLNLTQRVKDIFSNVSLPKSTNQCMQFDEPFVSTDLGTPMFDSEKLMQGAKLYANKVGATMQSALLSIDDIRKKGLLNSFGGMLSSDTKNQSLKKQENNYVLYSVATACAAVTGYVVYCAIHKPTTSKLNDQIVKLAFQAKQNPSIVVVELPKILEQCQNDIHRQHVVQFVLKNVEDLEIRAAFANYL